MDEDFIKYVEYRLCQWAKWYSDDLSFGLGFPSQTTESRLMSEGILIKREGSKALPFNEEAEEIEALILEMSKQNMFMALALRKQYCFQLRSRERAKQVGVCYAQFRNYVDMGKQWLAGRLSAPRQSKARNLNA